LLDYSEYLKSVSEKLRAAEFQLSKNVKIARFNVDLYAFKDWTGMSAVTSTHKHVTCIFLAIPNAAQRDIEEFSRAAVAYEDEKRGGILVYHQGIVLTRLVIPVIVSERPSKDALAFLKDYSPSLAQQYLHPVLVNLASGQINHRVGVPFLGAGYDRILNGIVRDYLMPV
jgi:hypothetical protein